MLRLRLTLLVCLFALAGLAVADAFAAARVKPGGDIGERVSKYARRFLGVPYRYGGASPRGGFDCSGFVMYVYRHFGVRLPHYTYSQYELGRRVPLRKLAPGDLVFFYGRGHVGLYVGRGRFIHAPRTGDRVRIDLLRGRGSFSARRIVSHRRHHRARPHKRRGFAAPTPARRGSNRLR